MSEKQRRDLALQKALRDNLRRRKGAPSASAAVEPQPPAEDGGEGA